MPNPTPKFSNWVVRGDFREENQKNSRQGLIFCHSRDLPLEGTRREENFEGIHKNGASYSLLSEGQ